MTKERALVNSLSPSQTGDVVGYYRWCIVANEPPRTFRTFAADMGTTAKTVHEIVYQHGMIPELNALKRRIHSLAHPKREEIIAIYEHYLSTGEAPPSYAQVGRNFGITSTTVYEIIKAEGLKGHLRELREAKKIEKREVFYPSQETAWFLGALFGTGGSVDLTRHQIELRAHEAVVEEFKSVGTRLFTAPSGEPARFFETTGDSGKKNVSFYNTEALEALGDFSRKERANTIDEKHGWVLSDEYVSHFAAGIIDSSGNFYRGTSPVVAFVTVHEESADLLVRMFLKLEIHASMNSFQKRHVVKIERIADLKRLAQSITLQHPEKQEQLNKWKTLVSHRHTSPHSAGDLLAAWERLVGDFGEDIGPAQIKQFRTTGGDSFSDDVFTWYLGLNPQTGKRSFAFARQRLNELMAMGPLERQKALKEINLSPSRRR